ncbi:hypothetical protein OD917_18765 [Flavobacterium sp. SH_e]|uniref:hypothetical protein n=1 Tax=Flavobacterium sp. SH_e TaxID=2983767 RepID=UPI0021E3A95A|nr:hypothetical protein [Flavobacterium sp. SH_e]MCV2486981.1 hypothetical protein [Flavobacterium sp. SH_e]
MKKLYMLLTLISSPYMYCQTYTIGLQYYASGNGCHAARYSWDFRADGNLIDGFSSGGNSMNVSGTQTYTVPNYTDFTFYLSTYCNGLNGSFDCDRNESDSFSAKNLLWAGPLLYLNGCNGMVAMTSFKPDVTIKNLDNDSPSEICAGFQLSLAAFPAGFPEEAYHWQYSLNNQATWVDVPAYIGGVKTNNTATPTFSMQELLGTNHVNYLNKVIYFRLGYAHGAFSTPLPLTYSPCAPIVTGIDYDPPLCNGNTIPKIAVLFDRKLENDEFLSIIYIVDKNNGAISNQYYNVLFDATEPTKYFFYNINPLVDKSTYQIAYQAQKGTVNKGTTTSIAEFTYNDPAKMIFKITDRTIPTCFGAEDGTIDIEIASGIGSYNFYVDNVLRNATTTKIDDLHYKIMGLKANPSGYDIKVTDKNNCLDLTAND